MSDEEESSSEVDVLSKLKAELILDYCSYKLWNEFKKGSKLSQSLLKILKDLYITKKTRVFDEELDSKLYCTRFICGLSEAMMTTDDGTVTYDALHPTCLSHADKVMTMYPFSAAEKSHFKNTMKLQVILSTYRAGKLSRAKRLFSQLYPPDTEETAEELFQEEIQDLFLSENERWKQRFLGRFSYQKFLKNVSEFLTPLWEKYDIPLLERFKSELSLVDHGRIPGFFLRAYHDCTVSKDKDCEASWQSIIDETNPDIKVFKKKLSKSAADQDGALSSEVDEEIEKSQAAIARLKKSSKQLNEFVRRKSLRSSMTKDSDEDDDDDATDDEDEDTSYKNDTSEFVKRRSLRSSMTKDMSDEDDDDDATDDEDEDTSSKNDTRKQSNAIQRSNQSSSKRKWNEQQEDAEEIEWSMSEDEDHAAIRLPSPKRKLDIRLPSPTKRRKKNPWTAEEVTWLNRGVQTYGEGNWSAILRMYAFRFRTSVDLKDKWRNINKNK